MFLDEDLFNDITNKKIYNSKNYRLKDKLTYDKVENDLYKGVGKNNTRYTLKGNIDPKFTIRIKNILADNTDTSIDRLRSVEKFIFDAKDLDDAKEYFNKNNIETKEVYNGAEQVYSLLVAMPEEMFVESILREDTETTQDDQDKENIVNKRHIIIDCAPGTPRPDYYLKSILDGTGIEPIPPTYTAFGEWGFEFDDIPDEKWEEVKSIIWNRLVDLYNSGSIRYAQIYSDLDETVNTFLKKESNASLTENINKDKLQELANKYDLKVTIFDDEGKQFFLEGDPSKRDEFYKEYIELFRENKKLKEDIVKSIEPLDSEVAKEVDFVFASDDQNYAYKMLSRLKSDNDYILGALKDNSKDEKVSLESVNKFLWFHDIDKQIAFMKGIYERLDEKPEWISLEDIDKYKEELKDIVRNDSLEEDLSQEEKSEYGLNTLVNSLIADELEAIDGYNSAIVSFEAEGQSEYTDVLRSIIEDERNHIGNLQEILNNITPGTEVDLNKGKEEAEEILNNNQDEN